MVLNTSLKFIRFGGNVIFYFILALMVLVILPGFPPYVSFKSFKVTPAVKLAGKLAPQYVLDNAVKLTVPEFKGSESIAVKGDSFYTGVGGGKVLKVTEQKNGLTVKEIARVGEPCETNKDQICSPGFPLGIRFDSQGNLVVVDGSFGIANVNPATGNVTYYFTAETPMSDGSLPTFPNDVDIGKDGTLYWSQFSSKFTVHESGLDKIGETGGRLIKFDPKTNTNTELLAGLFGANGVQLSQNQDFVLVAESFKSRVSRYYLKGPKAGTSDIFADGLPGLVDNIRPNGKGGFYVALYGPRITLIDSLSQMPQLRKTLFRLQWLASIPFKLVKLFGIQNHFLNDLYEYIGNFGTMGFNLSAKPAVVELDASGNILRVLTSHSNQMHFPVTQFVVGEQYAYFGGLLNGEIWKVAVQDLHSK